MFFSCLPLTSCNALLAEKITAVTTSWDAMGTLSCMVLKVFGGAGLGARYLENELN